MEGAAVTAQGLGLKGPRGPVFQDIDLDAPPGSLIAIQGPSGSGRTCLLLTLTGRMRPTSGRADVGGHRLSGSAHGVVRGHMGAVRRIAALGPVSGITDLDPALTVGEQLRERVLLRRRFGAPLRTLLSPRSQRLAEGRREVRAALDTTGLDLEALPKGSRTTVRDLERLEVLRLGVAMALLGGPRLIAVDDADLKLSHADRMAAWSLLRGIAAQGTTVLAVCSEAPKDAVTVRTYGRTEPGGETSATARSAEDSPDTNTPGARTPGKNNEDGGVVGDAFAEARRA